MSQKAKTPWRSYVSEKKIVQDFSVHETWKWKFMELGRRFLRYAKFEKLNILKLIHRDKDQMNIFLNQILSCISC